MTTLIYMPYFESVNRGVNAAQEDSIWGFRGLAVAYSWPEDVNWLLQDQHERGNKEDRLEFIESIWGNHDLIMIESTKLPNYEQLKTLVECKELLCSQHYLTNVMNQAGEVIKFPAHKKIVTDRKEIGLKEGCSMLLPDTKINYILKYCDESDDYADVSDLGIIKISQKFQLEHPNPHFLKDKSGKEYNDVERLHAFLLPLGAKWHRHKEAAYRNGLFHLLNSSRESEYLTEQEMRASLGFK